ncbi:E3 ubiquitin-protein ligase RNF128 [Liparis tanakae]|uniref:E3 ubiquitin-protein ligase RNF128 n=1 Tax=Liparis tanakae TaxID=230148 RepID=A0A4Z2DZH9_9TELE|nr:E3 ubiquitin-protein ligase RNF128 [Liparis tanakae]
MATCPRLLLLLCAASFARRSAAAVFWTAVVEISYSTGANHTVDRYCDCGVYGSSSPVERAVGAARLPLGDPRGCGPDPVYAAGSPPWIALVKRGNCTFGEKINAAKRQGAAGVLVYNADDNATAHMAHAEAAGIVAVMVGGGQAAEAVRLLSNGTAVRLLLAPGAPHGPWMDTYWLYFLSVAFFVVTAASVTYFAVVSGVRLHRLGARRRADRRLQAEVQKAVGRLRVRQLRAGDPETAGDAQVCAVCIEGYAAGEAVTVLTCAHLFHRACVEPWLLRQRTCPMCKSDILAALGVAPGDVPVVTVLGGRHYDNGAFEADSLSGRR